MDALSETYKSRAPFYEVMEPPNAALVFSKGRQNQEENTPLRKTKQPVLINPRNKLTLEFEHPILGCQFISVIEMCIPIEWGP